MAINLDDLRNEINKAGTNKGKFLFLKEGTKVRIRFLNDFGDGLTVPFHDSYEKGINVPCQEVFGRECKYCDDDELRTRNQYVWSVYDYESSEVKLLMHPVNSCTPVGAFASFHETYGTLLDRDYEVKKMGKGTNTLYTVVPLDKQKFRNQKVKAMSEQAILKAIDKAYPCEDSYDDSDEEEDEREDGLMNVPEEEDYDSMSPKELYTLCCKKNIECRKKMTKQYYLDLLEEDDW